MRHSEMNYTDVMMSIRVQKDAYWSRTGCEPNYVYLGASYYRLLSAYANQYFATVRTADAKLNLLYGMQVSIDFDNPYRLAVGYVEEIPVIKLSGDE